MLWRTRTMCSRMLYTGDCSWITLSTSDLTRSPAANKLVRFMITAKFPFCSSESYTETPPAILRRRDGCCRFPSGAVFRCSPSAAFPFRWVLWRDPLREGPQDDTESLRIMECQKQSRFGVVGVTDTSPPVPSSFTSTTVASEGVPASSASAESFSIVGLSRRCSSLCLSWNWRRRNFHFCR